jgi:hypothetical protein
MITDHFTLSTLNKPSIADRDSNWTAKWPSLDLKKTSEFETLIDNFRDTVTRIPKHLKGHDTLKITLYFSKTAGNAHFVPHRDNRWAFRADRCKPNQAVPIMPYRPGRSLVSRGNEMVLSVDPPMCFQYGTIEFPQKDYGVKDESTECSSSRSLYSFHIPASDL